VNKKLKINDRIIMNKKTNRFGASMAETYPWQQQWGLSGKGVSRGEIAPLVEEAFFQAITAHAWQTMGPEWEKNPPALKELNSSTPGGCEALARYLAKHFLKCLPNAGITQEKFWEDFCVFNLRAFHDYQEDDWFKAYVQFRARLPQLLPFLRRTVQASEAKETPEVGDRMLFCIFWDLFILPVRYWSDDATAELLCKSGQCFNLDKVRNTRRELGLKRARPVIVKKFKPTSSIAPGMPEQIEVELDDSVAKNAGVSAMLQALLVFLKGPSFPSRKAG
jgi:hypothetical protein